MSDITLTLVPWAPGTSVGAYPRRSEQLRPDGPPTGIPVVDTEVVADDASLSYNLADGEYWAAAPVNGSDHWQYVSFVAETPFDDEGHALAAAQSENGHWHEVMVDDIGRLSTVDLGPSQPPHGPPPYATLGDLAALEADDVATDARLDAIEGAVLVAAAPTGVAATDTAEIIARLAALPSTGGVVKLQRGEYAIDGQIVLGNRKVLQGAGGQDNGLGRETTKGATTLVASYDGPVIKMAPGGHAQGMGLVDLMVYGDTTKANQNLVEIGSNSGSAIIGRPLMRNVQLKYAGQDCLRLRGYVLNGTFDTVYALGAKRYCLFADGVHNNAHNFNKCQFREADQWGIRWTEGVANVFTALTIETNSHDTSASYGGVWFGGGAGAGVGIGITLIGAYFENNDGDATPKSGVPLRFDLTTTGASQLTEVGSFYFEDNPCQLLNGKYVGIGIVTNLASHAVIDPNHDGAVFIGCQRMGGTFAVTDNSNLAMTFGMGLSGVDAGSLYPIPSGAGGMRTDHWLDIQRQSTADNGLTIRLVGDGAARIHLQPGGTPGLFLGPGSSGQDTSIERAAAKVLNVKDVLALPNTMAAATAPNNSVYRDTADGILKVKDSVGTSRALNSADQASGQAGAYVSVPGTSHGPYATVANQARYVRFVPARNMTIISIAFHVTTAATADDACDVGIYSAALARLRSAGATTGRLNSPGAKNVALSSSLALVAGTVYYIAFSNGTLGGTAAQLGGMTFAAASASQLFGLTAGLVEFGSMAAAHPLPDPLTLAVAGSGPMLAVRES